VLSTRRSAWSSVASHRSFRNGETEATLYFFGFPSQEEELELTFNHDGSAYDLDTGYGHVAIGVDDLDATLASLAEQGIEPERAPYQVREGGSWLCFVRDPETWHTAPTVDGLGYAPAESTVSSQM